MARLPRPHLAGIPRHIVQRATTGCRAFSTMKITSATCNTCTRHTKARSSAAATSRYSRCAGNGVQGIALGRSEEHTSELQSLMRISYAVFCLKKKKSYTDQEIAQQLK